MAVPTFTVACLSKKHLAKDVYELTFEKPEGFTFKAGQFILFDVPHPDNASDIQARAYSIASSPDDPELLFLICLTEGGRMSRWITEKCKDGKKLTMKGPFGTFVLDEDPAKELLFLATSTGLAPFWSQLRYALLREDKRPMTLIYGARSEADLFYTEELKTLAAAHPNLDLHITLSQPSDSWQGLRGRVQTLVPTVVTDITRAVVYACGSPAMTLDIKKTALEEWGLTKKDVHVEGYI